jgi:poly(hydroxyalkanoate) granule-associated protein
MATKTGSGESGERGDQAAGEGAGDALRESAERIWLAGLGAFERMKSEGPRMFETLVEQGRSMSAQAKDAADKALRGMREANFEGAGRWEKFEQAIQERVSKSLSGLGVMTNREVEALSKQVAELNEHVRNLMAAGAATTSTGGRSTGARKAPRTKASRTHTVRKARVKSTARTGTRKAAAARAKSKKRSPR